MTQNNLMVPGLSRRARGPRAPVFVSARFGEYRSLAQRTMKKSKKMSKQ